MSLETEIQNIIKDIPVSFGIAIKNLCSGEEVLLNVDRPFQLANAFKIPILVAAIQQIDRGRFHLNDRIVLHDFHKVYPNDILSAMEDGARLPIKDLLSLMISSSDSTAIDMTLDLIGGPNAVNTSMRKLGFTSDEIRIMTSVHGKLEEVFGFSEAYLNTSEMVKTVMSEGIYINGGNNHDGSKVNTATPRAINRLNEMIFHGNIASHSLCKDAVAILLQQALNTRLQPDFESDDSPVDITQNIGMLFGVQNDSGIIKVRDNVFLAVTIFSKQEWRFEYDKIVSPSFEELERQADNAIRKITKRAYEYWKEQL